MKVFFALLCLALGVVVPTAGTQSQTDDETEGDSQADSQAAGSQDRHLLLALSRMAGMRVCDRMRNRFRTLSTGSRENQPASSGTLWIEDCTANTEGTRLAISLGGQGWRWIYRIEEQAGAEFEMSQYAAFAVDVSLEGEIDAAYDPDQEVFTFWYRPSSEPDVNFRPLGDVEVDTEGLWSSVVGGAASLFSRSPSARAREQIQTEGRKTFKERFGEGYTAKLDFCTGELDTGFGLNGEESEDGTVDSEQASAGDDEQGPEGTPAYMHPGGLILDGPHDVDPAEFSVSVESDSPLEAALICESEATRVARSFLDNRQGEELPEVEALSSTLVQGETQLRLQQSFVSCPVVVAFRASPGSPEQAFGFSYNVESAPLMEPAQQCER